MKCIGYFLLLLVFFCWSCDSEKKGALFPFEDFEPLQGEVLYDSVCWGRPSRMLVCDTLLYVADAYDDKLLTVLDLNTGHVRRLIDYGNGPTELMRVQGLSYNDQTGVVGLYDSNLKRVLFYDDKTLREEVKQLRRPENIGSRFWDLVPFDDGYIANGCFLHGEQFVRFGLGDEPVLFGEYPGDKRGIEQRLAFFLKTQTLMAVNPNQRYFAAAGVYHDQLVFYKSENGELLKVKEYFSIEPEVETRTGDNDYAGLSILPETVDAYQELCATEQHLYALYYGVAEKEKKKEKNRRSYILKLTWSGELSAGYIIDGFISRLAVDEKKNCFYTIRLVDEEYVLMRYEM